MYRDVSGLFTNKIPDDFTHIPEHYIRDTDIKNDTENEDDLLYGDDSDFKMPTLNPPPPKPKVYYNWWRKYLVEIKPTFWLFVVRENANLEIYSIPDFKLCFIVRNISFGYKVLIDSLESVPIPSHMNSSAATEESIQKEFPVKEILVVALGNHGSRPLLIIRLQNDLHVYEAFRFPRGNLKLRFKKIEHTMLYSCTGGIETENSDFYTLQEHISKLRYFSNIAGYNGVFICGASPHWLFLTSRGELRTHPMTIDGDILTFAPFNNINCPQGFLYFNSKVSTLVYLYYYYPKLMFLLYIFVVLK